MIPDLRAANDDPESWKIVRRQCPLMGWPLAIACFLPALLSGAIRRVLQRLNLMKKKLYSQHEVPDKRYFKIGEVSEITGVESYVLRFWETEFKGISPKRTSSGQRLYRKKDVELLLKIKRLLHEKKFTIEGARQHLKSHLNENRKEDASSLIDEIRSELKVIRDLLS